MPPWEKYQQQSAEQAGPWQKYRAPAEKPPARAFLNQGIARGLGAPVDIANAVLGVVGLGGEKPALGSQDIEEGLRGWAHLLGDPEGVPPAGAQAETLPARMLRGTGEAAGALPAFGLVAKGLSAGTGALAEAGKTAMKTLATSPGASMAAEATMGATSGTGGFVANKYFPGNQTAEFVGETLGGLAPTAAPAVAARVPGVQMAARTSKAALLPFTKSGATERAARRAQTLAADPERAAAQIEQDMPGDLTPAQKSGEPGLMALEQEVAQTTPSRMEAYNRRQAESLQATNDALREMGEGGAPFDTADFISGRRDSLVQSVQQRAREAARQAEAELATLAPEQRASEASRVVKEQIDKAYGDISAQESRIWGRVPKEAEVGTQNAREAYAGLVQQMSRAQREDIPEIAQRFLDPESNQKLGDTDTVNEVWGLRSKLLEEARTARANGQSNKARISDELADALLTDLGARTDDIQGEAGEALRAALDFTRAKKLAFDQGAVGRLREVRKTGEPRIPDEAALSATVGRGGERGGQAVEQITDVTQDVAPIRNHALEQFIRATTSRGQFNAQASRNWLRDNRDIVDRIPGLADDIGRVTNAHEAAALVERQAKRAGASLSNQRKSYTAAYLNADPIDAIKGMARARNPALAAREIVRQARKDPTGKALAGLKAALAEHLIETTGLTGKGLTDYLNERGIQPVVRAVLSSDEMARIRSVANSLDRLRAGRSNLPDIGGILNDRPAAILSTMARVLAAQQGRMLASKMGGGTVQTPGILSGRAQQMLERLTVDRARELLIDAINDPKKMTELLLRVDLKRPQDVQRLNAWLAGPAANLLGEEAEQP